jgi:hypothetical protein
MKNSFLYLLIVIALTTASCASINHKEQSSLSVINFDQVNIGANKDFVSTSLGKPSKIIENSWIYTTNDQPPQQRGAISFNSTTQLVSSKTFIPFEKENEENIDFLIQKKFEKIKFEKTPLQRCKRDYVPSKIFFINTENGLVIEFDRRNKTVDSVTWTTPEVASIELRKIQKCEK